MSRSLADLEGIGKAMLRDFELLGVETVAQLARKDPAGLYSELERITGSRQDPCVLDTFRCAVEQARHPDLEPEKRKWSYWSQQRKAGAC